MCPEHEIEDTLRILGLDFLHHMIRKSQMIKQGGVSLGSEVRE